MKQHPLADCRGAVPRVALRRMRGAGGGEIRGEEVGVGLRAQQEQQKGQGDTSQSKPSFHHSTDQEVRWDRGSESCTVVRYASVARGGGIRAGAGGGRKRPLAESCGLPSSLVLLSSGTASFLYCTSRERLLPPRGARTT